jgi:hypothetical protein
MILATYFAIVCRLLEITIVLALIFSMFSRPKSRMKPIQTCGAFVASTVGNYVDHIFNQIMSYLPRRRVRIISRNKISGKANRCFRLRAVKYYRRRMVACSLLSLASSVIGQSEGAILPDEHFLDEEDDLTGVQAYPVVAAPSLINSKFDTDSYAIKIEFVVPEACRRQ